MPIEAKKIPPKKERLYRELQDGHTYDELPEWARGGMKRYVEKSIPTGSGLRAVLEGDLHGVMALWSHPWDQARDVYNWCRWALPGGASGSKEKVAAWIAARKEFDDGDN
ncbi:MAG: hypothetical protein O3B04_10240 [Chloroflexi bacterium]|nr:hypothetical protein [Chloroflexota bacterium]